MSIKFVLIIIAFLDVILISITIALGIVAFLRYQQQISLAAYVIVNLACLLLVLSSLYPISQKKIRYLKFYFTWKCLEALVLPLLELLIIFVSPDRDSLTSTPVIILYVVIVSKSVLKMYFAYLIYSYYLRIDRGE